MKSRSVCNKSVAFDSHAMCKIDVKSCNKAAECVARKWKMRKTLEVYNAVVITL